MWKRGWPQALREAVEECAAILLAAAIAWLLLATLQSQLARGGAVEHRGGSGMACDVHPSDLLSSGDLRCQTRQRHGNPSAHIDR
jgi:hypothetical protein